MSVRSLPPGPKARPFFGLLPEFRRDPLGLLERAAQYGDIARLQLGPVNFFMLNHPDLIEEVLVTQNRLFVKGRGLENSRRLLGNGLLTSEGEFWRRQRRLAQPAFHKARINGYAETMVDFARRYLASWQDRESYDIHRDMMRLTLFIAARTLFSADVTHDADVVGEAMEVSLNVFRQRLGRIIPIPESWPTPANRRADRAARLLDDIIYRIIDQRRESGGEDAGDLLSMLMQAEDEDGTRMTPKQLRDEAMTLFLAGHETTANAMSWTWYLLGLNPDAEARLHAELDRVLGGRAPTPEDLPNLPYVDAVIQESMRLYPPAWVVGRRSTEPFALGGYQFPAGAEVAMSQWVMHRHPAYFPDPLAFRPERWLNGLARRLPRFAYFPFGGGPRVCIGSGFALMEAQLLLATIARAFRFRIDPGHPVVPHASITLRPASGIRVTAEARRAR